MIQIDKISYSSKLRYKSANLKSFFAVCSLLTCVISRSIVISSITLIVMGCLAIFLSGTSFRYYLHLLRIPLIFLILGTIAIIINYTGNPENALVSIPFFDKYLVISQTSLLFSSKLIITALASVSCLYFLTLTTPMTDILTVLKKIRCPALLIELMLLIYRFIFVLLDLSHELSNAQKSRLGNKDFKTSCYSSGSLMAILLVRAFQKSSYLYDAMESRCYNGTVTVLDENYPATKKSIVYVLSFEVFLIVIAILFRINQINL